MAKTKINTYKNVSLEQAQEASELFAVNNTELELLQAKMNKELDAVKSKYTDQVTALQKTLKEPVELLHAFANEQQKNWGKKKSFELLHCIISFRTGTPKVVKDSKFTWDAVKALISKNNVLTKNFLRTTTEINKEAILACKDEGLLAALQNDAYCSIDQEESFYVYSKTEELAAN
jgi:phage host-nuclease inhibitor protein Gam